MGAQPVLADLRRRLEHPEARAASRLTDRVLARLGARSPLEVDAETFNRAAEACYREELRVEHLVEALDFLEATCRRMGLGLPDGRAVDWVAQKAREALRQHGRIPQDICRQLLPVLVAVTVWNPAAKECRHAA
jgi:DNA-binding SARP family transcriptional activator